MRSSCSKCGRRRQVLIGSLDHWMEVARAAAARRPPHALAATRELLDAVLAGAKDPGITGDELLTRPALAATLPDSSRPTAPYWVRLRTSAT